MGLFQKIAEGMDGGESNPALDPSVTAAAEGIEARKRGRPRLTDEERADRARDSGRDYAGEYAKRQARKEAKQRPGDTGGAEVAAQLDQLFSPAAWRGIVAAPADFMAAKTGRKLWELSKDEKDTLAEGASVCARFYLRVNPALLAVIMFGMSVTTIYGARILANAKEARGEREAIEGAKP
jgi:hypothetical protein